MKRIEVIREVTGKPFTFTVESKMVNYLIDIMLEQGAFSNRNEAFLEILKDGERNWWNSVCSYDPTIHNPCFDKETKEQAKICHGYDIVNWKELGIDDC
jgi:hypothetical protein